MERQSVLPRFRTLAESAHTGIICTDEAGAVRFCSPFAAQLFGYRPADLIGTKVSDLIVADGLGDDGDGSPRHLAATGQRLGGPAFPIDLTVVALKFGSSGSLVWVIRDREDDGPLVDPATSLPARASCMERLRERVDRANATLSPVALLLISFDEALAGAALKEIADRLRDTAPRADLIGRLGEREFCVAMLDWKSEVDVDTLARMIADSLRQPITVGETTLQAHPIIGVAIAPTDGETVDEVLDRASTALERARKEQAAFRFFGAEISARLIKRAELLDALREAIDRNQFDLDFLPVIDLASGSVSGAEALLRWRHPQRGNVPPLDFIPAAEESGLMVPIGWWVIRESIRCVKSWREAGHDLRVSVNVSARQLHAPGFIRQLAASLASNGCRPDWLELELTEGVALQHAATVQLLLTEARKVGVRTALDDFGTGYSSMAYLKSLPVDTIKIDRTFVDGVPHNNDDSSIVRAIVALALCTGRDVRAEGVSDIDQARWLHAEGCDSAQGFFFSKPIPSTEFERWLTAYRAEGEAQVT